MTNPLADRIRPESLEQVVGQQHLLGPGKALRQLIESGDIPNLIFYGPAGGGQDHGGVHYCQAHGSRLAAA